MSEHPIALHHTHFSPAKQAQFLEALALWGNARAACRAASVAPQTAYRHRRGSRDFAIAWQAAQLVARPRVEDVLGDRALNGIEETIYYHGEEIGRRRRYDSRLLLAHLGRLDKVEECDDVAGVAHDFDGALERLRRGEPVDPYAHEDDDEDETVTYGESWEDERLPFPERVQLYLAWLETEDEEDEYEDDDDDLPDPYDCDDEDGDRSGPLEVSDADIALLSTRRDRAALEAIVDGCGPAAWVAEGHAARLAGYRAEAAQEQRQDSVTPVTLLDCGGAPASAELGDDEPEPEPSLAPPAVEAGPPTGDVPGFRRVYPLDPDHTLARRRWPGGPIDDGRLSRLA